ncbi:hypothetical protein ALQ60_05477 [Pseudomonas syringae pv. papulans]|nr:hypothetical protein ALQ60_05477 [Pseudomonas syringae pv. papulans]
MRSCSAQHWPGRSRRRASLSACPVCGTGSGTTTRTDQASDQGVLAHMTALDNHCQMFALTDQATDIAQRVAIHHQQIGDRAGCDTAQFAFALKDLRCHACGTAQRCQITQQFGANLQFMSLVLMHFPQQIRAIAHRYTRFSEQQQGIAPGLTHILDFGDRVSRQPEAFAVFSEHFVSDLGGHRKCAFFGHQPRGVGIDQVAMFDGSDTALDGTANRPSGVGMRHDVGVRGGGLVDDGADFSFAVLGVGNRVGWRGHTARGHDLDLVGALLQLLAYRQAHVVDAIHHAGDGPGAEATGAGLVEQQFAACAHVSMAAGLRQCLARCEDARAGNQPHLNRTGQCPVSAPGIAHGGKTTVEHRRQNRQGAVHDNCVGLQSVHAQVGVGSQHVHMAVDQAGHQCSATQIDDLSASRGRFTLGTYFDNALTLDHDLLARNQLPALHVQQAAVAQDQACGFSGTHW